MNKKILSILITVFMFISSLSFSVVASDYSGHWCEDVIDELMADGIINGDSSGVRPDDYIKRSEFVTLINKAFGFKAEGTVNFPDVSAGEWYFTQFIAAKDAGYLSGDASGNANPEKYITRVEASIILVRVMKLNLKETGYKFSDDTNIPEWGKEYVYILHSNGVIKGYPDGSFGAQNSLSRAESFSLIHSSKYKGTSNDISEEIENITTEVKTNVSISGGGGGASGGGGGGGAVSGGASSSTTFEITRKIENRPDENNQYKANEIVDETLIWSNIASSYDVALTRKSNGQLLLSKTITTNSVNVKELVKEAITNPEERTPVELFEVKVSCSKDNVNYTLADNINVVFPYILQPEVTIVSEISEDSEKLYIVWEDDANASFYTLNAKLDGSNETSLSYIENNGINKAEITVDFNTLSDTIPFTLSAVSFDKSVALDMPPLTSTVDVPLYASGEGNLGKPFVIKTVRHFKNISKNPSAMFQLASDITLNQAVGEYTPIETFRGTLTGVNTDGSLEEIRTVTVNSVSGIGLFKEVDGANIKNIRIDGEISGNTSGYTGSIAGSSSGDSILENCHNKATITSGGNYTGGLLGYSNGGTVQLKRCSNIAAISGGNNVGGLGGRIKTLSSADKCFNTGNISGVQKAGGIAGDSNGNVTVASCYNTGNLSADVTGGIVGGCTGTASVSYSYNTGTLAANAAETQIVGTSGTKAITDCYYLAAVTDITISDNTAKGLSDADMKVKGSLNGFDFTTVWKIAGKYQYPQLIDNPHIFIPKTLVAPSVSVTPSRVTYLLEIDDSNDGTDEYEVGIYSDAQHTQLVGELFTIPAGTTSYDIKNRLEGDGVYYVTVTAKGDGEAWIDSALATTSFNKEQFKFAAKDISVIGNKDDEYIVSWNVNDTNGIDKYLLTVKDAENNILANDLEVYNAQSYAVSETAVTGFVPGNEYKVLIKVVGDNPDESSEAYTEKTFNTLFASGDAMSGYVIKNERQFKNIALNLSSKYYLAEDISLDQTLSEEAYVPFVFSATLTGIDDEGNEALRTINVKSESGCGVFESVSAATIKNLVITGSVSGNNNNYTGGLTASSSDGVTYYNCHNKATVSNGGTRTGGLVGTSTNSTVTFENCSNIANVSGGMYTGGLVGHTAVANISKCFNSGSITATNGAGGLIGYDNKKNITISDCYNSGAISAETIVGGLMGTAHTTSSMANISNSYNAGPLSATTKGTLVGLCPTETYTYCYYLANETGEVVNGVKALSAADMQNKDNFSGFNWSVWNEPDSSANYKYPTLK